MKIRSRFVLFIFAVLLSSNFASALDCFQRLTVLRSRAQAKVAHEQAYFHEMYRVQYSNLKRDVLKLVEAKAGRDILKQRFLLFFQTLTEHLNVKTFSEEALYIELQTWAQRRFEEKGYLNGTDPSMTEVQSVDALLNLFASGKYDGTLSQYQMTSETSIHGQYITTENTYVKQIPRDLIIGDVWRNSTVLVMKTIEMLFHPRINRAMADDYLTRYESDIYTALLIEELRIRLVSHQWNKMGLSSANRKKIKKWQPQATQSRNPIPPNLLPESWIIQQLTP